MTVLYNFPQVCIRKAKSVYATLHTHIQPSARCTRSRQPPITTVYTALHTNLRI